jgi:hypothetical protein
MSLFMNVLTGKFFLGRGTAHCRSNESNKGVTLDKEKAICRLFHFFFQKLTVHAKMGANNSRESTSSATSGASTPQKYSDLVDLGSLLPCGIYPSAPQDYDYRSVRKLIIDRRIAPFYKGRLIQSQCFDAVVHGEKLYCTEGVWACEN